MASVFLTTMEEMLRILLLLMLGFGLRRRGVIRPGTGSAMSRLVALLFLPALNLYSNMMECRVDSLAAYGSWALYGAGLGLLSAVLATALAPFFAREPYQRGVYRYGLAVPNTGAVAMPLMLAFYGTEGLFQYSLFQFFIVMITYTWGIAQLLPEKGCATPAAALRKCINPNSVAMGTGILLGLLEVTRWMPRPVLETVGDLADCYVVVGLVLTGAAIAEYPVGQVLGSVKGYAYALLRLLIIPAAFLLLLKAVGAPHMVCVMAGLAYASPCGINVVVYPTAYGKEAGEGVSMVLLSSLGSVVTVPLIYTVIQTFFP